MALKVILIRNARLFKLFHLNKSQLIFKFFRSGSEDDAEFEQYLSKSNNDLNKSIQSEIIRRNQKKKNKKQDTFEDEMEDELDSILLSLQKKYSFNCKFFIKFSFQTLII